ncbi:MAG: PAS domain S-box protein [Nitrospirae bacterium]|nr:PAS domain S-box protein [Nitrospirota bacterium]MBF0591317.1 PAS domain S-box protein [Nitrospirota bacterium]
MIEGEETNEQLIEDWSQIQVKVEGSERHKGLSGQSAIVGQTISDPATVRSESDHLATRVWGSKESERMFKVIFEQAPVGIAIVESLTGRFVRVNQAYCNIFGYTQDEMLNLTFHNITYNGDIKLDMDNMKRLIAGEIQSFDMEKRYVRKNGQVIWASVKKCHLWESLDNPAFHIVIVDEITDKKRMIAELTESEGRYRSLFDKSPDAIFIADPRTGYIVDANQTAALLLGMPVDEIKGMHQSQLHPRDRGQQSTELFKEYIRDLINYDWAYPLEIDVVRANGDKIPCEVLGQVIYHKGRPFIQGVFRNISLRRYMEMELKTERDKLKRIADALTVGLYIVNKDHDIELVNGAMIRDFGETNGRKCYAYLNDRTEPCPWCRNEEVFAGETVKREWYSPKTQKTYSLLGTPITNADGSISKFEIFFDITDIKKIQLRQKRELELQMAAAEVARVSLSPDSSIYDIAVVINRHAMELTGSLHGFVSEIDRDTNSPQTHPSYKGCVPEGHVSIQRFLSVPAKIQGRLIGQISVANAGRDYTNEDLDFITRLASIYAMAVEHKRLEEELRNLNANLEVRVATETEARRRNEQMLIQQSKMAAMGEMIVSIAHQWKQPLSALSLFVQDLKSAYIYDEVNEQYIDKMVDSSMRQIMFMSNTMDDFKNFFKPSKERVTFNVRAAIEELIFLFIGIFNKNDISIEIKTTQGSKLLVAGYPNEFKQVILNILSNSKDAIMRRRDIEAYVQGHIEITFHRDEHSGEITLSIRDNGGGIPECVIERIFEPYFTTKESGGTGIGLYMSKTIIETNMAGSLTVSNVEDGAEFIITLQGV